MRPLTLHASALSDGEYDFYTSSLRDIASEACLPNNNHITETTVVRDDDDAHYEHMAVGAREVRAWLRGRYAHIPAATIDHVLKFFSASLGQGDVFTGGQFFAVLRLVVHVDNGKQADRSLAFIQADPACKKSGSSLPPPPPSRRHHNGTSKSVSLSLTPTIAHISSASSSTTAHNPFSSDPTRAAAVPQAPPQHPMLLRVDTAKPSSSHNPFTRASQDPSSSTRSPPLPPRKPPPPIPPSSTRHGAPPVPAKHRSTSPVRQTFSGSTYGGGTSQVKPVSHVTSTLIKQSLHASKVAQSLKKAEEQLEKERIMQVLKRSSGPAVRNRSTSPTKNMMTTTTSRSSSSHSGSDHDPPPLPRRRDQQSKANISPPPSVHSFDQIALAGVPPRQQPSTTTERGRSHSTGSFASETSSNAPASATSSPSRFLVGLPGVPPPTHPDRREPREERDRRYSSVSVQSARSSRLNEVVQSQSMDTRSFDSVYGADGPTNVASPGSPNRPGSPGSSSPEEMDSVESPSTARVFRSKSFHSSLSTPVPPLARRKRPESFQVSSTGGTSMFQELVSQFEGPGTAAGKKLSRHQSLSTPGGYSGTTMRRNLDTDEDGISTGSRRSSVSAPAPHPRHSPHRTHTHTRAKSNTQNNSQDGDDEPLSLAALQRTFASLQPKLDKARYKAEAGISKRGFIPGGMIGEDEREGLVRHGVERDDRLAEGWTRL